MSRSKDGDPERSLSGPSDEALVALYLGDEATSREKDRIRAELQRRYYPHFDRMREGRPAQGSLVKKRAYAVLLTSGVDPERADEWCEECCSHILEELFLDVAGFEDLLRKFDPQRSKSSSPFRYWVINVRVNTAVRDWLRKQGTERLGSIPPDETLPAEDEPVAEQMPPAGPLEGGPWVWWDGYLIPRHGTVIRLLHLAYLDLNECYLGHVAREADKTQGDVHAEVGLLQRRLRPAMRFGDGEAMEEYALRKMLDSEHLGGFTKKDGRVDEAGLGAIIADGAEWTSWRFPGRAPIEQGTLRQMLLEAIGKQPTVAELKQVVRRWIDFLKGQLVEGELHALTAEIERWERRIKHDEAYLRNLGLDDRQIAELEQSAEAFTLGKLEELQQAVAKGDERTRRSLAYQEHVLRLNRASRKRVQVLTDYISGKNLVTPLQREMADMLGLSMGGIGGRVAKAKRALSGAVIWREVLAVLADLDEIARHQRRLDRLGRTCVVSFEGKALVIGVPEAEAVRWWNVLLPCVKAILKKPPVHGTVKQYERTGMTIVIRNYEGDWPCGSEANGRL